jgi:hypothetical protein
VGFCGDGSLCFRLEGLLGVLVCPFGDASVVTTLPTVVVVAVESLGLDLSAPGSGVLLVVPAFVGVGESGGGFPSLLMVSHGCRIVRFGRF